VKLRNAAVVVAQTGAVRRRRSEARQPPEGLPTFLLAGSPQSGSSWLHRCLSQHPAIDVRIKEVYYFTYHFHRPLDWYSSLYDPAKPGRGDMTPHYVHLSPDRIEVASRVMPDVRLLALVRDPVEVAWSKVRRKVPGRDVAAVRKHLDDFPDRPWFHPGDKAGYAPGLRRWIAAFPEDAMLLIDFDAVRATPQEVLRRTFDHIKVHPVDVDGLDTAVNTNPPAAMSDEVRAYLEERYAGERAAVSELLATHGQVVRSRVD
jgi:hypothetical protein